MEHVAFQGLALGCGLCDLLKTLGLLGAFLMRRVGLGLGFKHQGFREFKLKMFACLESSVLGLSGFWSKE